MQIRNWAVKDEIYSISKHNVLLSTTEYINGTTILSAQIITKRLGERIRSGLKAANVSYYETDQVRYYIFKTYGDNNFRQIKQTTFFNLLKGFDRSKTKTRQEILEQYDYTDKSGRPSSVMIAITREKDEAAEAAVEFESEGQIEAFVLPEWLSGNIII